MEGCDGMGCDVCRSENKERFFMIHTPLPHRFVPRLSSLTILHAAIPFGILPVLVLLDRQTKVGFRRVLRRGNGMTKDTW